MIVTVALTNFTEATGTGKQVGKHTLTPGGAVEAIGTSSGLSLVGCLTPVFELPCKLHWELLALT